MDPHRLAEMRSLAYHQQVARRIRAKPDLLDEPRRRVERWCSCPPPAPRFATEWRRILRGGAEQIARFITADTELACELRQSSPFAGVMSPRERWQLWRTVRTAAEGAETGDEGAEP